MAATQEAKKLAAGKNKLERVAPMEQLPPRPRRLNLV
jgi:hypothetical protein